MSGTAGGARDCVRVVAEPAGSDHDSPSLTTGPVWKVVGIRLARSPGDMKVSLLIGLRIAPNRLPTVTLVRRPINSSIQCVAGRELGSGVDADYASDPAPNNTNEPSRKIPRDIHEHARDVAGSLAGTEGFEQSRRERKKIEMRFAHLKRILRLGRLQLRGPRGAQDEFVLAAITQNLRRLASLVARPPPDAVRCIA